MSNPQTPLITEVLGITNPDDKGRSIREAYETLTDERFDTDYYLDLMQTKGIDQAPITEIERYHDLGIIGSLLVKHTARPSSTLTDWPVYEEMMRQHGTMANGSASALMIGSISAMSSRAFVRFAETQYGANDIHIVDPVAGKDKVRHGNFTYGSGLALPYKSESMDFVHTNQLIHMLKDPSSPSRPHKQKVLMLFSEIARVLAPGGQVFMKEAPPETTDESISLHAAVRETRRLRTLAAKALHRFGVEHVHTDQSPLYEHGGVVLDPDRNFKKHRIGDNACTITIYARKAALSPAQPHPGKIAL
jgi:SAM-dependent methyltransferase